MKLAYLDIFMGISGDMLLGALVDAGCPLEALRDALAGLPGPVELRAETVTRGGLQGTLVHVTAPEGHHHGHGHEHRSYRELAEILDGMGLAEALAGRAHAVLLRLAEAEATVHGVAVEEVHFHELGGLDTLVDLVGALAGLEALGVERVLASPLPTSHGYVDTAHGRLPVPPPAVMELLRGVPTRPVDVEGETVTPTGAALAVCLAEGFGPAPEMTVSRVAHGAGQKEFPGVPNLLRLLLGETEQAGGGLRRDAAMLIETNVDDMNPELMPALVEALLAAGALDAWLTPIVMKKGRPALLVSALAAPPQAEAVAAALLEHSTSFGVRLQACERRCLPREMRSVETPWGTVGVKVGLRGGRVVTASPEYEDCARLAREQGMPVRQVYAAAAAAAAAWLTEE